MIKLGAFALVLILSAAAVCAQGQPAKAVPRIGYLGFLGERDDSSLREAFMRGLRDLGYLPGVNVAVDIRRYDTDARLRQALAELIRLRTDVIFVGPPFAAVAAKQMTQSIAIVCGSCGDPVENSVAVSLAHPGGNVTGLASLSAELIGKRVGLFKDLFPSMSRVAVFVFPANPGTGATRKALEAAGRALGVEVRSFEIRNAGDFDTAFRSAAASGAAAVVLQDDPLTRPNGARIAELALRHRLPVSTGLVEVAQAGALMAYGPDRDEMARRAATFVDKILKGAKPADLPFEQAAKLQLVVNLKTAKALGIAIPAAFLLRADYLIE